MTRISDTVASGEVLDPMALLGELLPHINSLDIPLAVTISDGSRSVSYILSVFISKEYEVVDGHVKFGLKRLVLKDLKVNISFDLTVLDDTVE